MPLLLKPVFALAVASFPHTNHTHPHKPHIHTHNMGKKKTGKQPRKDDYWDNDEYLQDQEAEQRESNELEQDELVDVDDAATADDDDQDDDEDDEDDEGIVLTSTTTATAAASSKSSSHSRTNNNNNNKQHDDIDDDNDEEDEEEEEFSSASLIQGNDTEHVEHEDPHRNYTYAELNVCVENVRQWIEKTLDSKDQQLPSTISSLVSLLEIQKGLLDLKHAVNVPDVLDILVANRVVTVEQNAAENHPISLDLSNSTKNLLLSSLKDEPANLAQVVKATLKRLVELQSHVRITTTSITTTTITTTSITTSI
jgi:hypothetical protein